MINRSFEGEYFPKDLGISVVTPVYTNDSPENPVNYRHISITLIFLKILKKVFFIRLLGYFEEKNNILSESQSGFRPKLNTHHAIQTFFIKFSTLYMTRTDPLEFSAISVKLLIQLTTSYF